ncbi:chemotaxis protein CheX [Nocardioides marmoriginsengisoli]|uniref:Chemotaxis protein CheX n=1 Tax=Nocardioides marmoriginsengisoli TaxID=661483 RepID=A0A3N0CGV8_9ACTN|nr:chemotaxis protein CheX [Nocardioides marmoriginsengisoli]RNL62665.1 chemotaxis protein CheX [Nocardioides marmoriginsengisoli]
MTVLSAPSLTDVQMVVDEVWGTFLGTEEPLVPGPAGDLEVGWSAAVSITGEWRGLVSVELPGPMAAEVTRRMLGLVDGLDPTSDEDVADAVGELVNMIGGNVKSLMPGPSTLSLPVVAAGRVARPSDVVEACRLDAGWGGAPLVVSVHVHA